MIYLVQLHCYQQCSRGGIAVEKVVQCILQKHGTNYRLSTKVHHAFIFNFHFNKIQIYMSFGRLFVKLIFYHLASYIKTRYVRMYYISKSAAIAKTNVMRKSHEQRLITKEHITRHTHLNFMLYTSQSVP